MQVHKYITRQPIPAPSHWHHPCTHTENTLHQLSPYIGKQKSAIVHDLIAEHSRKGDLVADAFCGSGTVPLESVLMSRRAFASDANPYAIVLTRGKLTAPTNLDAANAALDRALQAGSRNPTKIEDVPNWVRDFYHPDTLTELLSLIAVLRQRREYFLLACLLGIAHHQRPGFLSFPSSHLVPYLRNRKFPQSDYPELYKHRSVEPRLRAKLLRALTRHQPIDRRLLIGIRKSTIQCLTPPSQVDCYLTSPPYMNALDYGRDNRLRNWLLTGKTQDWVDDRLASLKKFQRMMESYARLQSTTLVKGGRSILIVGESTNRNKYHSPSELALQAFDRLAPSLKLREIILDQIPDVRRSRRNLQGVKAEQIFIFERR